MDDMGDDDDDGDADDSPTAQYVRQDSLKGKSDPEGSQVTVTRPKLEPPDVRSILVSEPLLISPPDRLPATATSPPAGVTTHFFVDSPYIRRPAHKASRIRQPGYGFIVTLHLAISKSPKA
jgi:hypothetical protein